MEHVEVLKDQFVDYAGKTHYFIIAAISDVFSDSLEVVSAKGVQATVIGEVEKGIRLGIAICNPEDKFVEKTGVCKAIGRARESETVLYASYKGLINTKLVRALLEQEADYLKHNPEKYIVGYAEGKERFLKKQEMNNIKEKFTEVERIVVDNMEKDPTYLDNVTIYLNWVNRQKKCKKQGK